jgi:hypothetical protein
VLVAAAQLPDLIWPLFLLLGWERVAPGDGGFTALAFVHYPWSHSLALVAAWALVAALAYAWLARDRRGALVVALLVLSHWLLDFVTHRPDLPLYPGGRARLGLGLWNSTAGTLAVEAPLWIAGAVLYATGTRPVDRIGRYAVGALVAALTMLYTTNLNAAPPADMRDVALGALAGWLVPVWAEWGDRHREPVPAPGGRRRRPERGPPHGRVT